MSRRARNVLAAGAVMIVLSLLLPAFAAAQDTTDVQSVKQIRQRAGWQIDRLENLIDEAEAALDHAAQLRDAVDLLVVRDSLRALAPDTVAQDTVATDTTTTDPEPEPVEGAVFTDDFASGDLSHTENGYSWGGVWNASVRDGVGRSGTPGLEITFPAQADGSDSKSQANLSFGVETQEVWVEYWLKVPSNYLHRDQNTGATNNKFFGLWRSGRLEPKIVPELQRVDPVSDGDREESWVRAANYDPPLASEFGGTFQDAFDHPFVALADHGTWVRVRWHVGVGNTDGSGGGIIELWKNDVLFHSDFNADKQFHEDPTLNHFGALRLLGWSNSGYDEETAFVFDDLRIYTADPGW